LFRFWTFSVLGGQKTTMLRKRVQPSSSEKESTEEDFAFDDFCVDFSV
jgi:hypothetical protein